MFDKKFDKLWMGLLFVLALFVFSQGLSVHGLEYRDDEIFYFKSTQEMIQTGDYLSPKYFGEDRFQKPILFYWLIVASQKIFGSGWFAARFVSTVFAALTVCITWLLGRLLFSRPVALLSSLILATMPLFFRHAKNAVPDMALNFFIVLALYYAVRVLQGRDSSRNSLFFFISCGLGFMIKGFAAWIAPIGTVLLYALWQRNGSVLKRFQWGRGLGAMLAIVLPWFIYMIHTHGIDYFHYMVVDETANRLMNTNGGNVLLVKSKVFLDHFLFYTVVIFQYFAPWSLFIPLALLVAFYRRKDGSEEFKPRVFLLIWTGLVLSFFSFMYFTISHYMLIISTPMALLVGSFLIEAQFFKNRGGIWKPRLQKMTFSMFFGLIFVALLFMTTFIVDQGLVQLYGVIVLGIIGSIVTFRTKNIIVPPLMLAALLVFINTQTRVLSEAGVASHSIMQRFARTIQVQAKPEDVVGVGSHDIHEKELQVYFNKPIQKAGHTHPVVMQNNLQKLFSSSNSVYCLLTAEDFKKHKELESFGSMEVLQEDYTFRRRMYLDKDFMKAVVHLDRATVKSYLMEKIILIRKGENDG